MSTEFDPQLEQALIERARQGDPAAFEELMKVSSVTCRRLAISILRNSDDADDAVQTASMKAWNHVSGFQGNSKFSTWFTRIVVNQCLMRLRSLRRATMVSIDAPVTTDDSSRPFELPDTGETQDVRLDRAETARLVREEVQKLPPLLREPLVLRDLEMMSIEEVASRLDLTVPATKSRLLRARNELKRRMEKHVGQRGPATLLV